MTRTLLFGLLLLMLLASVIVTGAQDKPASIATAPVAEFKDLDALMKSLPAASVQPLNLDSALVLTTLPLSCVDELQPKPTQKPYFWQPTYKIVDNLDKSRAFYSCND